MKKRLNIFCVCMIAAFLLSVSGNVYLIIEMFVNGVEVGMKAAQGEITEIPQYKMVHVLPTDMMETTGTVTNLKDGRQLAVKPITALVECPYSHSSHGFEVLQGLIGFSLSEPYLPSRSRCQRQLDKERFCISYQSAFCRACRA